MTAPRARTGHNQFGGNATWKGLSAVPPPAVVVDRARPCWRCAIYFRTGDRTPHDHGELWLRVEMPELRAKLKAMIAAHQRRYCERCCDILLKAAALRELA